VHIKEANLANAQHQIRHSQRSTLREQLQYATNQSNKYIDIIIIIQVYFRHAVHITQDT